MIAFQCEKLRFQYRMGEQLVTALDTVDLTIQQGEFLCLSGPSGSGKSTLLNLLGLIEPLQHGEIFLNGKALSTLSAADRNHIRRHEMGFIFQSFNLFDVLTAEENVEFFLARQKVPRGERKERVEAALKNVGIWDFRHHIPPKLSGGQRQRVAIARALAKCPQTIIADEPTASLDQTTGSEIMDLLKELNHSQKLTLLIASHDPMVLERSKRVLKLKDGKVQP